MKYVCLCPWGDLESYYLCPKDLILEVEVVMFMILLWVLVLNSFHKGILFLFRCLLITALDVYIWNKSYAYFNNLSNQYLFFDFHILFL